MLCVSNLKRALCCLLTAALLFTMTVPTVDVFGADNLKDIKGHWAETYIRTAVAKGIVGGYPDGTFLPDKAITRAEFSHMLNAALGNKGTQMISFSDVPQSEWFYTDISKAMSASYVSGYEDKTFRPNNPISRQEAAAILARIVPVSAQKGNLSSFPDYRTVSDWASDSLARINAKGYIGTYNDGKLHPLDSLTRAQTAKIICDLLSKETIVASDPNISDSSTRHTNKIFTNDVTISPSLGNGSASLDQCVILGTLNVKGGGENTVTVANSRVIRAAVDRGTNAVRVLVSGESNILNMTAANHATIQTSAIAGGSFGPGIANVDVAKGSTILFSGNLPSINLTGTAEVTLTSGTVNKLTVSSNASGSDVTVESSGVIKDSTVNAKTAFHGAGTIRNMTINANGVTYAKKPESVVMGPNMSGSIDNSDISISPKNGATNVSLTTDIKLTFNDKMTLYNGSSISNSDISDFVELREGSTTGKRVNYSASINSGKNVITIDPDTSLDGNTKYYVIIDRNELKDSNSNGNAAFSSYFTTEENGDISISPKNGASNVDVDEKIVITFADKMKLHNGDSISNSDIEDFVKLRRGSSSGRLVDFDASINSAKKVITIEPDEDLEEDTRYYVIIDRNELKDSDGDGNAAFSSYFSTSDDSNGSISISPKRGASNVSVKTKITLTFDSAMKLYNGNSLTDSKAEDIVELRRGSSSGKSISFEATVSSSKKVITIEPDDYLDDDTRYYVIIDRNELKDSDGDGNASFESHFSTGDDDDNVTATFNPKNGATDVSVSSNITITYPEKIEAYNGSSTLNNSYLQNAVDLRVNSSSGARVGATISIDSGKRVITIAPTSNLSEGTKYYVNVNSKKLRTVSGETSIPSSTISFTTKKTVVNTPVINSLSLSSNDSSVTAKVAGSMSGTVYAVLVPSSSSTPSADQIIAGSVSGMVGTRQSSSISAGSTATLTWSSGVNPSTNYKVCAVLVSGAVKSSVSSQTISTSAKPVTAKLTKVTVTPDVGSQTDCTLSNSSTNITLPAGTKSVTIKAVGTGTIKIDGDSTTTKSVDVSALMVNQKITVKVEAMDGNTPVESHTINLSIEADTSYSSTSVSPNTGGSGLAYTIDATTSAVTIRITANDPDATITANNGGSGTGIGTLTINNFSTPGSGGNEIKFEFTITSRGTSKDYTITLTKEKEKENQNQNSSSN